MHRMRRTKQAFPRATVETHTGPPSGIRRRRPICDRSEMTGPSQTSSTRLLTLSIADRSARSVLTVPHPAQTRGRTPRAHCR
jgi:hypothetical protein